jgi:hypothetical protein
MPANFWGSLELAVPGKEHIAGEEWGGVFEAQLDFLLAMHAIDLQAFIAERTAPSGNRPTNP